MPTRTGSFSIGFRQGKSDWQQNVPALINWARENHFEAVDLRTVSLVDLDNLQTAKLRLGSVDLIDFGNITQADAQARTRLIEQNVAWVKQLGQAGVKLFFSIVGGDRDRRRSENYKIAVDAFAPIAEAADSVGAKIAVEGYPGSAPHYALLCTTPETCRSFLKDIPRGMALNYDPSHLIRLGVDPVRFLKEFIPHVVHVHGKDTQLFPEAQYEYGLYQPSAFTPQHRFGQSIWRYTIPGNGCANWAEIFTELKNSNYQGCVSIELEDEDFDASEASEKSGLIQSLAYLQDV